MKIEMRGTAVQGTRDATSPAPSRTRRRAKAKNVFDHRGVNLTALAEQRRQGPTDAERLLWEQSNYGHLPFLKEPMEFHHVHRGLRVLVPFAIPYLRIVVLVRNYFPGGTTVARLRKSGHRVVIVSREMVLDGRALEMVQEAITDETRRKAQPYSRRR